MIGNVGTHCIVDGPCLVPVFPGLEAPSGVLLAGVSLILRDLVQRWLGLSWSVLAVIIGGALSALVAPKSLVLASTTAYLLAELLDCAVYTPLQRRRLLLAVVGSGAVGLIVDSVAFLLIAYGSLSFLAGLVLGKVWMTLMGIPVVYLIRLIEAPARTR